MKKWSEAWGRKEWGVGKNKSLEAKETGERAKSMQ